MKQATHIAVATATNLAIFKPTSINSFALVIAASTIGGIISDIDVTTSESHKELEKIIIISFIAIVLSSICEVYFNIGIFNWLQNNLEIAKNLGLILAFFCICFWGMHQPHRSFMHSITSVIILSTILFFIYKPFAIFFAIAMLTHICIDLFNKKKIQLLYPLKFKFCFNLCESGKTADKIMCKVASIVAIIEAVVLFSYYI